MKTLQRQLLAALAFLFLCAAGVSARAQVRTYMAYVGAYSAGTTYNLNDVVTASGVAYISLTSGNIGNTPATSTSAWVPVGSSGGGGTTYTGAAPIGVAGSVISVAVGTGSGTVAAGNDSRITGAVQGAAVSSLTTGLMAVTNGNVAPRNATGADVTAALGYTPIGQTPLPSGLMADYNFLQRTGTTLTDTSVNGANGTLGAGSSTVPSPWTATGLSFNTTTTGAWDTTGTQGIQLPSGLNGVRTIVMAVYMNTLVQVAGIAQSPAFPVFLTSSLGASGLNLMAWNTNSALNEISIYGMGVFAGGVSTTQATNQISGFHVLAWTFGSSAGDLDKLYIDGKEIGTYTAQGHSAGVQTSGNLYLGSSNTGVWAGNTGCFCTMYRAQFYSAELTSDQVQTAVGVVRNDVSSRGVPVVNIPQVAGTPLLIHVGDSITYGLGGTTPFPTRLTLDANQPTYKVLNFGIDSITLATINAMDQTRVAPLCTSSQGPVLAVIMAGTNDLFYGFTAPAQVVSYLAGEVQTLSDAGCKTFVGTMLSRTGTGYGGATSDSLKNAYNTAILKQARNMGAVGVIDFAAVPGLGADGANTGSMFGSDHVHPNDSGYDAMALAESNTLNRYGGSSSAAPTYKTATYALTSGDGYVSATCASACVFTLPDCTGPSGATYTVANLQSANATTVVPLNSSQLINGISFGTSVTVPSNGSLTLRDVPNARSAGGCHWEY